MKQHINHSSYIKQKKGKVLSLDVVMPEMSDIHRNNCNNLTTQEFQILIEACIQQKRAFQKILYSTFFEYASSICLRYASNDDDAMEILNDGFLKIFTEIKKFQCTHNNPIGAFKSWLKKIIIYTAIDHFRKNKKHSALLEIDDDVLMIAVVEETNLDKLSFKEINACIQKLPPAYRTVFSLYVLDGFTHEEIGKQLGIATGTSKSNLSKARIHLQKMIGELQKNESYEQRAI